MFGELFGKLFGTGKATEKLIDNVSSGLDKLHYGAQERAEAQERREIRSDAMKVKGFDVIAEWLKSTSGSRLARRIIALVAISIWAIEHIGAMVMHVASVWVTNPEQFIKTAEFLKSQAADDASLVGVVLLFYFGGPVGIEGVKGLVNKWANYRQTVSQSLPIPQNAPPMPPVKQPKPVKNNDVWDKTTDEGI